MVARVSDTEFVVGMYYQDEEQVKARTFKRIMQAINLRPIKTSKGYVAVSGAMAVSCSSRQGKLYQEAEQLIEAAAQKVVQARATGSVEVAL